MGLPPGGGPPERPPIPEAEITTRPPAFSFIRQGIPPPAALYISRDDRLFIASFNSNTLAVLNLRGRYLDTNGDVIPFSFRHTPNTDRSSSIEEFSLAEGFLLDLMILAEAGGPLRRGATYVQAGIQRGGAGFTNQFAQLISDYMSCAHNPSWPAGAWVHAIEGPGLLRSITGTDPAAGAEISETVPTNARWRLINFGFDLVTDATAATRRPRLDFNDGSADFLRIEHGETLIASLTGRFDSFPGLGVYSRLNNTFRLQVIPELILSAGFVISTATTSLQAGDNYGAPRMLVEEWIEE